GRSLAGGETERPSRDSFGGTGRNCPMDGRMVTAPPAILLISGWDVAVLDGGIAAWEAAGYRLYSGVHVPSKAFAEVVEHEAGTPYLSAPELKALIDSGTDIAIFDSRSYE